MAESETRTFEIVTSSRTLRIKVPENWKITYGLVHPGSKSHQKEYVLRMYESDTKQRAIFRNVVSFRDTSLEMQELVITSDETGETVKSSDGSLDLTKKKNITSEWVDVK